MVKQHTNAHSLEGDSLISTIKEIPVAAQVTQLLDYAKNYQYSNPALSAELVEYSLELAESVGDPLLLSNVLNARAIMNFYSGNNREAAKYIMQSIDYVKQARQNMPDSIYLVKRLAAMYGNAGNIYQAMGEMDSALEALLNSLSLSETLIAAEPGDISNLASRINTLNNTAVVYQSLDETAKADNLLSEALKLSRDLDVPRALLPTLNNIGLIRINQKKYDEAIGFYMEALKLGQQVSDSMGISGSYNNLGLIYEKVGNKRKALSYYLKSLDITQRLGFSIGIANTSANVGRLYGELNIPDSAVFYVKKGIDEATRSGNNTYLMKNYETLSSIYEKTGEFGKALDMHKKYMGVKDSIFDIEKNRQIEEMTVRFETREKEKENQLLKKNIDIQQQTTMLLIIGLAAIFFIALLLYYLYRLKNKALKQQSRLKEQEHKLHALETARLEDQLFAEQQINRLQNEKLAHKNRELSSNILHIMNKNKALKEILRQMENFRNVPAKDINHCYNNISTLINNNLNLDDEWQQFRKHFEEVHPSFFKTISDKYPELTSNELRLCAYLRINLSSKEIAQMMNVSPDSIVKSRYRLRKKLALPHNADLTDFIQAL